MVIDTNIFLAGLLNLEGGAAKIVDYFRDEVFELIITREVIAACDNSPTKIVITHPPKTFDHIKTGLI